MKTEVRIHKLFCGQFRDLFDKPEYWEDFFQKAAYPARQFIIILECRCGCTRILHYSIGNAELVFKPGKVPAQHNFEFHVEVYFPKEAKCGKPLPIPISWLRVPTVRIHLEVTCEYADTCLHQNLPVPPEASSVSSH